MTTPVSAVNQDDPYASMNARKEVKGKNSIDAAQDRFLRLLTTQLQQQDPLNPMDNAAVTSQMAQISTVQGIEKLNKTMEKMAEMYASAQTLSAANMVGRSALVPGSGIQLETLQNDDGSFSLPAGKAPRVAVNLPQGADELTINVYNENQTLVDSIALGRQEEGVMEFAWDGTDKAGKTLPAGTYSFSVAARNSAGEAVASQALSYQRVTAVSWTQGSALLHLPDGSRVGLNQIYQLGV